MIFPELCNQCHYLIAEHFYHLKREPGSIKQPLLTPHLPQGPAVTSLPSGFRHRPNLGIVWPWNRTAWWAFVAGVFFLGILSRLTGAAPGIDAAFTLIPNSLWVLFVNFP